MEAGHAAAAGEGEDMESLEYENRSSGIGPQERQEAQAQSPLQGHFNRLCAFYSCLPPRLYQLS